MKNILLISFLLIISGCSFTTSEPDQNESTPVKFDNIELYYNRSGLTGSNFEQFKILNSTLIIECGSIAGGRHTTAQQQIINLDDDTLSRIYKLAEGIRHYVEDLKANFTAPGGTGSMFDAGKLSVKLTTGSRLTSLSTSFDSVALGTSAREITVAKFTRAVRAAAGGKLCDRGDFYGLNAPKG